MTSQDQRGRTAHDDQFARPMQVGSFILAMSRCSPTTIGLAAEQCPQSLHRAVPVSKWAAKKPARSL